MLPRGEWNLKAEWHYIINNNINIGINIDIDIFCAQVYNSAVPSAIQKDDQNKSVLSSEECGGQTNLTCGETSRLWFQ